MEKYKAGQFVYSKLQQIAIEILPEFDDTVLFSCSVHAANKYTNVYTRLSSGLEVFEMLDERDRMQKRLDGLRDQYRLK